MICGSKIDLMLGWFVLLLICAGSVLITLIIGLLISVIFFESNVLNTLPPWPAVAMLMTVSSLITGHAITWILGRERNRGGER